MNTQTMDFTVDALHAWLDQASDAELDQLPYGVIGMDREGRARRYNHYEVSQAGFAPAEVIGRKFFEEIARCMDNGMVAGRFLRAVDSKEALDATMDYVLAFRASKTRVKMRLLHQPSSPTSYLLIERLGEITA